MKDDLKIYEDFALLKEVKKEFDFGILEAGNTKEFTYYIYNDTTYDVIEIEIEIENPYVKVVSIPSELKAKEKAKLVLLWDASSTAKKGAGGRFTLKWGTLYD